MPATLGYWNARGLGQPIRLLLEYTGTEYEDKRYELEPALEPGSTMTSWLNDKDLLGLDFPNLPYFIDGDIKITQSNAILRYIARKNNLCGETEQERVRVDIMENQATDFQNAAIRTLIYSTNSVTEELREGYLKDAHNKLNQFSKVLGSNQWFSGMKITCVDFLMYEFLDQHRILEPSLFDDTDILKDFLSRFEALPTIAAYMKSDGFLSRPITPGKDSVIFVTNKTPYLLNKA